MRDNILKALAKLHAQHPEDGNRGTYYHYNNNGRFCLTIKTEHAMD